MVLFGILLFIVSFLILPNSAFDITLHDIYFIIPFQHLIWLIAFLLIFQGISYEIIERQDVFIFKKLKYGQLLLFFLSILGMYLWYQYFSSYSLPNRYYSSQAFEALELVENSTLVGLVLGGIWLISLIWAMVNLGLLYYLKLKI